MSYSFERIPSVIWGSGNERYGDKDAKDKAIALMKETNAVFVSDYHIRDYESHFKRQILKTGSETKRLPVLYRCGSIAHAIPADIAIKMLKDFKPDFFDGFMLRDYNLCNNEMKIGFRIEDATNEHLVLDFNGLIYSISQRTDHCYD